MVRLLIAPLIVAIIPIAAGGELLAQNVFPAPLPGQTGEPPVNGSSPSATPMSPFPSYDIPPIGALGRGPPVAPAVSRECVDGYTPLREDAEKKSKLITAASERRASPVEACKLIDSFRAAQARLIRYVETNAAKCTIPAQIAEQLNASQKKTTDLLTKVCTLAQQQMRKRAPAGPTGDFWPTTTDAPI
jgi:hypothetical protein